jgi:hypothetical protein
MEATYVFWAQLANLLNTKESHASMYLGMENFRQLVSI